MSEPPRFDFSRAAQALGGMAEELGQAFTTLARALNDALNGPLREMVQYYAEHPEELAALVAEQEKFEADLSATCHCICQWNHDGRCTGGAATSRNYNGVDVPMCATCANEADLRRTETTEG